MDTTAYFAVAGLAEQLIDSTAVRAAWEHDSALSGYTVGGLAGHLARAVLTVEQYCDLPVQEPAAARVDAAGYFARVLADHDPHDSAFHQAVRDRANQAATTGPDALVAQLRIARHTLQARLSRMDPETPIQVLDGTVMEIREYLATRLVELVVHVDDLAVSVDVDTPAGIGDAAYNNVAAVLAQLAVARNGGLATIRSLARRERAPEAVRAL